MRLVIRKYITYVISIYCVVQLELGFKVLPGFADLLIGALILNIFFLLKKLIDIILFPLHMITLNLSNWILSIFLVYLWALVTPSVQIIPFRLHDFELGPFFLKSFSFNYWISGFLTSLILVIAVKLFTWVMK